MYCPNCSALIDGTKFCRSCGANVSLVPQALTGQVLATSDDERRGRRGRYKVTKPASIEEAATSFFTGIGFILAALFVIFKFPGGFVWGWSLFIPAFACIGEGVGLYLRFREQRQGQLPLAGYPQPQFQADPRPPEIPAPTTSELKTPSSVTENTTKHLDASK